MFNRVSLPPHGLHAVSRQLMARNPIARSKFAVRPSTLNSNLATHQPHNTLSIVRSFTSRRGSKEALDLVQLPKTETTSVGTTAAKAADQEQAAKDREAFATEKHRLEPTSTHAGQKQARSVEQPGRLQQAILGAMSPAIRTPGTSKSTDHHRDPGERKRSYNTVTTPDSKKQHSTDNTMDVKAISRELRDVRERVACQRDSIASMQADLPTLQYKAEYGSRVHPAKAQYQEASRRVPGDSLLFIPLELVLLPIYAIAHGGAYLLVAFVGMGVVVCICEGLRAGYEIVKSMYIGRIGEADD